MSKKSLLGIGLTEWKALSGLSDPYSLELAKISAEAGVPRARQLSEGAPGYSDEAQDFDAQLEAYLENNGSSIDEYNDLISFAIESGDVDLQNDLLEIAQAAVPVAGAAAKGAGLMGKIGAKVGELGGKAVTRFAKGAAQGAKAAGQAGADMAKATTSAAGKVGDAAGAVGGAPKSPAPTKDAPVPASTPGAATAGENPAPAAGAAPEPKMGGNTADGQPGQTSKIKGKTTGQEVADVVGKKEKEPTGFALMKRGVGKLGKAAGNTAGGLKNVAKKGVGQFKAAASAAQEDIEYLEDVDHWEEFLGENGMTVEQYMAVVEHAYEVGDEEMIEELHQLDEIFGGKRRRAAAAEKHAAGMAAIKKGAAIMKSRGKQTIAKANASGVKAPPAKQRVYQIDDPDEKQAASNEAVDRQLRLMGYTDEYIEARGRNKRRKINRQYGLAKTSDDPVTFTSTRKAAEGDVKSAKSRGKDREHYDSSIRDMRTDRDTPDSKRKWGPKHPGEGTLPK